MTTDQATRYRAVLGAPDSPRSLAGLAELVSAHLSRIPFENLSKLIRHARGVPPTLDPLDEYLDRCEHLRLGGTCYACASHFNALLRRLGYDARLCGAAMSRPDVHAVNIVHLGERDYLIDVGYGAPLFAPLPLDARVPSAVHLGPESFVLHPRDAAGHSRLDHLRDGEIVHGYNVDPTPRDPDYFAAVIADSFRADAEFLNRLRIVLHTPARSIAVHNFHVAVTEKGAVRKHTLPGRDALRDEVEALFGIPREVTGEALAALAGRI